MCFQISQINIDITALPGSKQAAVKAKVAAAREKINAQNKKLLFGASRADNRTEVRIIHIIYIYIFNMNANPNLIMIIIAFIYTFSLSFSIYIGSNSRKFFGSITGCSSSTVTN